MGNWPLKCETEPSIFAEKRTESQGGAVLDDVLKDAFSKEMTFEKRPEWNRRMDSKLLINRSLEQAQACQPEFSAQNPHTGGREEHHKLDL